MQEQPVRQLRLGKELRGAVRSQRSRNFRIFIRTSL
jgi:hypothetical protein